MEERKRRSSMDAGNVVLLDLSCGYTAVMTL